MRNRVPTKPGRVKLTPENGGAAYYATIERADEPVEAGTPISKETLLTDETAELLGLNPWNDPTVDEAFVASVLASKNACMVKVTVTVGGLAAKGGIEISGLKSMSGGVLYTSEDGTAVGLTTTASTAISTCNYIDLPAVSKTISTPISSIVYTTLGLQSPASGEKTYTGTTKDIRFSPYVTSVDVCCVGGGGGAGGGGTGIGASPTYGGGGGGGGRVTNKMNASVDTKTSYTATVGAGGAAGTKMINVNTPATNGSAGGSTSFLGVYASGGGGGTRGKDTSGGSGGSGNGAGGYGAYERQTAGSGIAGETHVFNDSSRSLPGGGGGGGGSSIITGGGRGSGYGGSGGDVTKNGHSGTVPGGGGGGGGGGYSNGDARGNGAQGGNGQVYLRWRVTE